jgi:hypothetical protein
MTYTHGLTVFRTWVDRYNRGTCPRQISPLTSKLPGLAVHDLIHRRRSDAATAAKLAPDGAACMLGPDPAIHIDLNIQQLYTKFSMLLNLVHACSDVDVIRVSDEHEHGYTKFSMLHTRA